MITVKKLRNLISGLEDDIPIAMTFKGCLSSDTPLSISEAVVTTVAELLRNDCDEGCDSEDRDRYVVHLLCDRELFVLDEE